MTDLPPIAILIPVLARPWRAGQVLTSIEEATPGPHRVVFLCTESDHEEIATIRGLGLEPVILPGPRQPGDWARKINLGFTVTDEPLLLLGADDLRFHPGWHEAVAGPFEKRYGVIGTQDLGNRKVIAMVHSTHPAVARWYVDKYGTADERGKVCHEGYGHYFVDDELVRTALHRHEWTFAPDAIVEHLHPHWGKAPSDRVYDLGQSTRLADQQLFHERRHLWT